MLADAGRREEGEGDEEAVAADVAEVAPGPNEAGAQEDGVAAADPSALLNAKLRDMRTCLVCGPSPSIQQEPHANNLVQLRLSRHQSVLRKQLLVQSPHTVTVSKKFALSLEAEMPRQCSGKQNFKVGEAAISSRKIHAQRRVASTL